MDKPRIDAVSTLGTQKICSAEYLNYKKGKTSQIENLIKEKFNLNSCVKIEGDKISVTVDDKDASVEKANNIIKEVQSLYDTQMYITVKFQNK